MPLAPDLIAEHECVRIPWPDADDRCAEAADSWHLALLEKRFSEVPL
jgi:hypothetical protein